MNLPFMYRPEYETRPAGKQLPDNMFSELPKETHLLHLMTLFLVYGNRTEKEDIQRVCKKYQISSADCRESIKYLSRNGYLIQQDKRYYNTAYTFNYRLAFPLSQYVFDRHPEWFAEELHEMNDISKTDYYIWGIAAALYDKNADYIKHERGQVEWSDEKRVSLLRLFKEDYYRPLIYSLDPAMVEITACQFIQEQMLLNELSIDVLEKTNSIVTDYQEYNPQGNFNQYKDKYEAYRYFLTLTPPSKIRPNSTIWAYISNAIRTLKSNHIKEAGKLFDTALKMHNRKAPDKNMFYDTIAGYFLMIYYAKSGEEGHTNAAKYLKKAVSDTLNQLPATIVARYIVAGEDKGKLKADIDACLKQKGLLCVFGRLFSQYFNLPTAKSTMQRTEIAILEDEPLLQSIRMKEPWEKVLDQLIASAPKKTTDDTPPMEINTERIAYLIDKQGQVPTIHPHRQRWLKTGKWSAMLPLNVQTFAYNGTPAMDKTDREIASHLKGLYHYDKMCEVKYYLPYLIDSDRVFIQQDDSYLPVTIRQGQAWLNIEEKDNRFVFSSNVQLNSNNELDTPCIVEESNTTFCVIDPSEYVRRVLRSLLSVGSIPKAAEHLLRTFIATASKYIEIHSDMIEGGSYLKQAQAQNTILLRVTPRKDEFAIETVVQPLEGGKLCFFPATGKEIVYDEKDNTRYQVRRNLPLEKQHWDSLNEYAALHIGKPLQGGANEMSVATLLALMDFIDGKDEYVLEWPEGIKIRLRYPTPTRQFELELKTKEDWFEVEGCLQLKEGDVLAASDLLRLMQENTVSKRFVRLNHNEFVALSEQLAKQLQVISRLVQFAGKKAVIPRMEVGLLGELLQDSNGILHADDGVRALLKKIADAQAMQVALPKGLHATLRDYQVEGYEWMSRLAEWGAGACLADDMGLGKTVQTIALMLARAKHGASLVVAPASVIYNWQTEWQRFAPSVHIIVLNDTEDRQSAIADAKEYDVVLMTYGLLIREEDILTGKHWNVVCLDEAHTIKNRSTKMSATAMRLKADVRIALTGTPLQNHLSELWNLFRFVTPGLLDSYETFLHNFITPIESNNDKERRRLLRRILQPFLLRRTKAEVIDELPEKTEITRHVQLTADERIQYEKIRIDAAKQIDSADKVDFNVLAAITRLRQAACSMNMTGEMTADGESSKLNDLRSLTAQIIEGGNYVLIFSQFTTFLKMAEKVVEELSPGCSFYLDGNTPLPKRREMMEQFQRGERQVFLVSLKAGGLGLNLTSANYVIHLDPWWNPAVEQQATDRTYRIGQHRNITVYHLIAADTIEEKILRLHKTKRDLADALLQDRNTAQTLTLADLKELVAIKESNISSDKSYL